MKPHVLVGNVTVHKGDPLCGIISAETRGSYTHSILITDPSTNEIYEQYAPHCRFRHLTNDELPGIHVFRIKDWTDEQDAKLRLLIAQRNVDQIPYWIDGLLRFGAGFRAILGEATDADFDKHAFCSMEVFECIKRSGTLLLNANCYEVSPVLLSFSTLLIPQPQLLPVNE